jgi:hypothetical protein
VPETASALPVDPYPRLDPAITDRYRSAQPYPHGVFDSFFDPAFARKLVAEFPPVNPEAWINYTHVNERKFGKNDRSTFPPSLGAAVDELNAPPFVAWLERLTGIRGLRSDPSLEGGGLHQTQRGGHLNIHADFTGHPHHPTWRRRVNVIVYLNEGWREEWGGALELWNRDMSACVTKVAPLFNRVAIFNTDQDSFHGLPDPLACPDGTTRKSLALYYFTDETQPFLVRSTEYRARPGDGAKGLAIWADKLVLRAYDKVKRRFNLDDRFASKVLGMFSRKK